MLMYEDNARMANTVAKAVNPALPQRIIGLGRFDSMFKLYDRLQNNAWVGILGDRVLPNGEQMPAPFFGESALFPTSPYRIALMLKRPVLFMTGLYRGGNRYELHFEKLFDAQAVPRHARARVIEQALRRYAARLEHYCREAPYNWFNFYDFWESAAQASASRDEVNNGPAVASADRSS